MLPQLFMVFDVEAVGLHGEGYAYGYVVIDRQGNQQEEGQEAIDPNLCDGSQEDRTWIEQNVPSLPETFHSKEALHDKFWETWLKWKAKGAVLVADCPWPVEARFLNKCVDDMVGFKDRTRTWEGPYPLYDLASMLMILGADPLANYLRLESELPRHNPLCDAKQSARILSLALKHAQGNIAELALPV